MKDENWDLVNGPAAHDIEVLNYSSQVNVIEALHKLYVAQVGIGVGGCPKCPQTEILCDLHRTGTLFLLERPGQFRETDVHVARPDGTVVYEAPPWREVPRLMAEFETDLKAMWPSKGPVELAAFALWKINWVHPFKNGNGRTARAFAYACLCLKYGIMLPGQPTVIDLIMNNRGPYQDALADADRSLVAVGTPDLSRMIYFVDELVRRQVSSVLPR